MSKNYYKYMPEVFLTVTWRRLDPCEIWQEPIATQKKKIKC